MPQRFRDCLLGIDWSGRTCNTVNARTRPVYAKAKLLLLRWEADAVDGSREKEAAAWLAQASHAILLRTNELDRRLSEPIKLRIERFLDGEWERVWDDFLRDADAMLEATGVNAPPTPEVGFDLGLGFNVPHHDHQPPMPAFHFSEIRRFDRALKLCKLGRMADAVRALMPAKRAPRNAETLAKVRGFFPAPRGDELDLESLRALLAERDVEEAFSLDTFAETIRDAARGKAADRFGCRAEHLQALLGSEDGRAAIALIRQRELAILAGKAPASILSVAGGGRLIALEKPDNRGVRPVVVVDTPRKLALSAIAAQVRPSLQPHFSSSNGRVVQHACGVSRGTQKFHLAVSEYLRLNKTDILVLADSDNAFQRVSVQRAVEGAKRLGEAGVPLLWAIAGLYATPSPISFFLENGTREIIERLTGVLQGCPLGTLLFCLAVHPLVVEALEHPDLQDVKHFSFADDSATAGPMGPCVAATAAINKTLNEKAGLSTKYWKVLRGVNAPSPDAIRAEFEKQGLDTEKLQIVEHGIDTGSNARTEGGPRFDDYGTKLMGGPVGSRSFAERFVGDLADHHATALEAIRPFGARHPRRAINMLMFCSVPRMQHAYSMVPWDIAREHYARAHSLILTTAAEILGFSDDEARARDVRVRLSLPMTYGGLGLADPEVVARHALIGNFTACVNDLKNYAGLTGLSARAPERAARAAVRRDATAAGRAARAAARAAQRGGTADEGPCWGAWETAWNAVRGGLQRDLSAAKVARDHASDERDAALAAPVRSARRIQAKDFALKRATKLHDDLVSALHLFPCGASEVATLEVQWKARGVQKALSKVAHARIFTALHKQYLDDKNYTAAATLLSTAAPGAMAWVTFNDDSFKSDTLSSDNFRTAMRFSLGLDQPVLVAAATETADHPRQPCGHCGVTFPTAEHYQTHALTVTAGTAGGSTYNTHNHILEAVANCAKAVGVAYSIGTTFQGVRNADGNCRLGNYTDRSGARHEKYADIAFLDMPQSAFNAQRVYGDVTHRTVVGIRGGDPAPVHLAHLRAGAALQVADAEKTLMYDQALRGRQNEKVAILGIEAGGRMHKHFHRLIDTFAKFKADADAGTPDDNTSPASIKFHQSVFSRTKSLLMGRIQVARVKCVAERIMHITRPRVLPAFRPAPARLRPATTLLERLRRI